MCIFSSFLPFYILNSHAPLALPMRFWHPLPSAPLPLNTLSTRSKWCRTSGERQSPSSRSSPRVTSVPFPGRQEEIPAATSSSPRPPHNLGPQPKSRTSFSRDPLLICRWRGFTHGGGVTELNRTDNIARDPLLFCLRREFTRDRFEKMNFVTILLFIVESPEERCYLLNSGLCFWWTALEPAFGLFGFACRRHFPFAASGFSLCLR